MAKRWVLQEQQFGVHAQCEPHVLNYSSDQRDMVSALIDTWERAQDDHLYTQWISVTELEVVRPAREYPVSRYRVLQADVDIPKLPRPKCDICGRFINFNKRNGWDEQGEHLVCWHCITTRWQRIPTEWNLAIVGEDGSLLIPCTHDGTTGHDASPDRYCGHWCERCHAYL